MGARFAVRWHRGVVLLSSATILSVLTALAGNHTIGGDGAILVALAGGYGWGIAAVLIGGTVWPVTEVLWD